jgi:hypothetical protein
MMKLKKKFNYTKGFKIKKLQLKEWGLKLNFIFDWRVKLKRKINLIKEQKNNNKKNEN